MDDNDEIRKLVEKSYKARRTSIIPVPDDKTLSSLLARVANSKTKGLSWKKGLSQQFEKRLLQLGYTLVESDECWLWTGGKADNGTRPKWMDNQAYQFTIAAFENRELVTSANYDTDHKCGNSLCVRPGPGHAQINLRSIHERAGQQDGVNPKAPRNSRAKK